MTNLARAKAILGSMFNRDPANITNAQIDRAARGLAYKRDPISGLSNYNTLSDADKLAWYVDKVRETQANWVAEMEAAAAAQVSANAARAQARADFTADP